jgi:transposase-like protein
MLVIDGVSADICRYCAKPAIFLEHVSSTANVDYFRCDSCGHTWSIEKSRAVSSEQPRSQASSIERLFAALPFRNRP